MLNSATENQGHGKGDGDGGGEGNVTAEPDETQNTAGLITKNQQLSGRSKYTVPSWICEQDSVVDLTMGEVEDAKIPADDNEEDKVFDESGDASFTLGVGDSGQRRNAFQDCMPMYQDICKLESAPGEYGKIPRNSECGAEERKEKLYSASVDTNNNSVGLDCASYPAISTTRVMQRTQMAKSLDRTNKRYEEKK